MRSNKVLGKYELGNLIGEGGFSKVKHGVNTESGERVAIKILDKASLAKSGLIEQIKKEVSIMKRIHHKNIVNLRDVLVSRDKLYLVMELITGGDLFTRILEHRRLDENTARSYFQQLIQGLEYCHGENICHRDLKPENLLLDENGTLKISDFGLSALHRDESNVQSRILYTSCGSPNYVAPEVIGNNGYEGTAADVWSTGVILYVMLAGFLPFDDESKENLFKKIKKSEYKYPPWFSSDVKRLIDRILVPDVKKRYTITDIKLDPWFSVNFQSVSGEMYGNEAFTLVEDTSFDCKSFSPKSPKIKITNAFDLISMSGAFDLTPILINSSSSSSLSKSPERSPKKFTRFSTEATPETVVARLEEILNKMPVIYKLNDTGGKIQVSAATPSGLVVFEIEIHSMSSLYMVDFVKLQGNSDDFYKFFQEILDACESLVSGLESCPSRKSTLDE